MRNFTSENKELLEAIYFYIHFADNFLKGTQTIPTLEMNSNNLKLKEWLLLLQEVINKLENQLLPDSSKVKYSLRLKNYTEVVCRVIVACHLLEATLHKLDKDPSLLPSLPSATQLWQTVLYSHIHFITTTSTTTTTTAISAIHIPGIPPQKEEKNEEDKLTSTEERERITIIRQGLSTLQKLEDQWNLYVLLRSTLDIEYFGD